MLKKESKTKKSNNKLEAQFWTKAEFSQIVNVSSTTLNNLLEAGQIKGAILMGTQWRIHKESFLEQLKEDKINA